MLTHLFTLRALCPELHTKLRGSVITEVYSQERNELVVAASPGGALQVSVEPRRNHLFLRTETARARRNSVDLFEELVGRTIGALLMEEQDRTVIMVLDNGWRVLFRLYDTAASDVVLLDAHGTVMKTFKGNEAAPIMPRMAPERVMAGGEFFAGLLDSADVLAALKRLFPGFGTLYLREILVRAEVTGPPDAQAVERLRAAMAELLDELRHPAPVLYRWKGMTLSVAPLRHLTTFELERFASVNEAVRVVQGLLRREESLSGGREEFLRPIQAELHKTSRAKEKVLGLTPADPAVQERIGKILLAHLHELTKGARRAVLQDPYHDAAPVEVTLDPALSPSQNAERYFAKAKKTRHAVLETARRLSELTTREEQLRGLEADLLRCETADDLKAFVKNHHEELKAMHLLKERAGAPPPPPFRIFPVAGDLEVWVGKSSANNDLLTMKYAKPHDLWFHVRGASGSHTVLKVAQGVSPPKESIRQAAAIAAYYSKMRNAGSVPVAYCERKYVRKPRGANQGAVTIERETVVFVKPGLP